MGVGEIDRYQARRVALVELNSQDTTTLAGRGTHLAVRVLDGLTFPGAPGVVMVRMLAEQAPHNKESDLLAILDFGLRAYTIALLMVNAVKLPRLGRILGNTL